MMMIIIAIFATDIAILESDLGPGAMIQYKVVSVRPRKRKFYSYAFHLIIIFKYTLIVFIILMWGHMYLFHFQQHGENITNDRSQVQREKSTGI